MFRHQLPHHQVIRQTNGCTNCRRCGQIDDDGCLGSNYLLTLFFTSIKEKKTQKINLFCWSSLLSMVSSFEFYYGWLKSLKTQFRVIDILWIFLLPAFKKIKAQIVIAIVLICLYLEGVWVHADTPPDSTPVPLTKFFCYIFFHLGAFLLI